MQTEKHKAWRKENRESLLRAERKYRAANPFADILKQIRIRAKKKGIECTLTIADLGEYPSICPVLGIPIIRGKRPFCASVDRINNDLGYTKENVVVVSYLANRVKSDASVEQLRLIADFYSKLETERS